MRFGKLYREIKFYTKQNKPVPQGVINRLNRIYRVYFHEYSHHCTLLNFSGDNKDFLKKYDQIDQEWGAMKYLCCYFGKLEAYNIAFILETGAKKLKNNLWQDFMARGYKYTEILDIMKGFERKQKRLN